MQKNFNRVLKNYKIFFITLIIVSCGKTPQMNEKIFMKHQWILDKGEVGFPDFLKFVPQVIYCKSDTIFYLEKDLFLIVSITNESLVLRSLNNKKKAFYISNYSLYGW